MPPLSGARVAPDCTAPRRDPSPPECLRSHLAHSADASGASGRRPRPDSGRRGVARTYPARARTAIRRPDARATRHRLVRRARKIDRVLAETYPTPAASSTSRNPFELLVVDRAQRPDHRQAGQHGDARRCSRRTPTRPRSPPPTARTSRRSSSRPASSGPRPTSLLKLAQALVERYDGEVPGRLEDLVTLPGVGRKTANVVLGDALRRARDHRRHALRPAGPALRLDRRRPTR